MERERENEWRQIQHNSPSKVYKPRANNPRPVEFFYWSSIDIYRQGTIDGASLQNYVIFNILTLNLYAFAFNIKNLSRENVENYSQQSDKS